MGKVAGLTKVIGILSITLIKNGFSNSTLVIMCNLWVINWVLGEPVELLRLLFTIGSSDVYNTDVSIDVHVLNKPSPEHSRTEYTHIEN